MDNRNITNERERKLWMAVLERAVTDLGHEDPVIRTEAIKWFEDRRYDVANSFVGICREFRLNPYRISESILENHGNEKFRFRSIYEESKDRGYQWGRA